MSYDRVVKIYNGLTGGVKKTFTFDSNNYVQSVNLGITRHGGCGNGELILVNTKLDTVQIGDRVVIGWDTTHAWYEGVIAEPKFRDNLLTVTLKGYVFEKYGQTKVTDTFTADTLNTIITSLYTSYLNTGASEIDVPNLTLTLDYSGGEKSIADVLTELATATGCVWGLEPEWIAGANRTFYFRQDTAIPNIQTYNKETDIRKGATEIGYTMANSYTDVILYGGVQSNGKPLIKRVNTTIPEKPEYRRTIHLEMREVRDDTTATAIANKYLERYGRVHKAGKVYGAIHDEADFPFLWTHKILIKLEGGLTAFEQTSIAGISVNMDTHKPLLTFNCGTDAGAVGTGEPEQGSLGELVETLSRRSVYGWRLEHENYAVMSDAQIAALGTYVKCFPQADEPEAGMDAGDYWLDTDDNSLYVYSGSEWILILDAGNAISVYRQDAEPSGEWDFWVDTDDDNKLWIRIAGSDPATTKFCLTHFE